MNCMFTRSEKQNLRSHVQLSMSSAVSQNVCESSWETNLELREVILSLWVHSQTTIMQINTYS